MASGSRAKWTRRALRRAVGPVAGEVVRTAADAAYDYRRFMERGLFARFKWLLFGR